jgi:hypothetical protein
MNLLKRYESDDFDESYAFEDAEYEEIEESGSSKPFLVKAIAMLLAVTGIAYGANIALTSGSGNKVEFGQGFQVLTSCDTAQGSGIDVIPYAGFINDTGTGKFSLDSIILEKINKGCVGNDFIIQVYGETGTALTVSETATNGTNYQTYDIARFWYKDSSTVVNLDMSFIDFDVLTDTSVTTEYDNDQNSVQVTFDPDRTPSFADASQIRRITIQTVKHGS